MAPEAEASLAFSFWHHQVYLPDQPTIMLIGIIHVNTSLSLPVIHVVIAPFSMQIRAEIELLGNDLLLLYQFAQLNRLSMQLVSAPWLLEPVYIPKPWGREIWYTGIETRGQALVKGIIGSLPLAWLLALFPQSPYKNLILLKVLDPLPDEVFGDLYFELHQEKEEVYVVTHVDQAAWPDGIGQIQLGFDIEKLQKFDDLEAFKCAYLDVVRAYENVRRTLDAKLDNVRQSNAVALGAPADVQQLKQWMDEISQHIENKDLLNDELMLRMDMNSFVSSVPIKVGDAIAIPKYVPHALQHGVRVVEFQTPVYERKILSFAQKVLTQDHWDTEEAIAIASFESTHKVNYDLLLEDKYVRVERIVTFEDFIVHRIHLKNGSSYQSLDCTYALIMVIQGELILSSGEANKQKVIVGETLLLPKMLAGTYSFVSDSSCLFLYAVPGEAN